MSVKLKKENGLSSPLGETNHGLENPCSLEGSVCRSSKSEGGDFGGDWGMSDWQTCAVSDSFVKNKVGRKNQIPAKDISEVGRFPVIDQGQEFVAGYLETKAKSFQYGTSVKCGYDVDGKPVLRIPNVVGDHVDPTDLKFGKPKKNELGKLSLELGDLHGAGVRPS